MLPADLESLDPCALPSLPLLRWRRLPFLPAIYFVLDHQHIVRYVGQTQSLRRRWYDAGHRNHFHSIQNGYITWEMVDDGIQRARIEKMLIRRFCPSHNCLWIPRPDGRTINVPISQEVHDMLSDMADDAGRTLPQQCAFLLQEILRLHA